VARDDRQHVARDDRQQTEDAKQRKRVRPRKEQHEERFVATGEGMTFTCPDVTKIILTGGMKVSGDGKRGRGRPRGALSWWKNSANVAAHHATTLMEIWLATSRERRHTVPVKVKRKLVENAIAYLDELHRQSIDQQIPSTWKRPNAKQVLQIVNRRCPPITLRRKKLRK
jgi:hypothetical protein